MKLLVIQILTTFFFMSIHPTVLLTHVVLGKGHLTVLLSMSQHALWSVLHTTSIILPSHSQKVVFLFTIHPDVQIHPSFFCFNCAVFSPMWFLFSILPQPLQ